jgi:spore germination cell wall hydrolase CwlJ-like protein
MLELLLLVLTIYLEAEGESFAGKQAVANVIYNRHIQNNKTITEVILKPKQFSCWNDSDYVLMRLRKIDKNKLIDSFKASLLLKDDITNIATHYTRVEIRRKWMRRKTKTLILGNHKFMKRKEKKGG